MGLKKGYKRKNRRNGNEYKMKKKLRKYRKNAEQNSGQKKKPKR